MKKKQEAEQAKSNREPTSSSVSLSQPNVKETAQSVEPPSTRPQVEDSLAKLNSKITQQKSTPSAMDLFLAAAAESEQTNTT